MGMEAKEAECKDAEEKAGRVDLVYKNSVTAYKNSKDRARDLMKRLGQEEANLRASVEAWVDKYCEAQRRATSARGRGAISLRRRARGDPRRPQARRRDRARALVQPVAAAGVRAHRRAGAPRRPPRTPRARRQNGAPQVMGFADTYFRSTVVWSLGADMALDGVVSKDRVPVSSYEATEDDPRDSKPEGEDWNEVDIAARQ